MHVAFFAGSAFIMSFNSFQPSARTRYVRSSSPPRSSSATQNSRGTSAKTRTTARPSTAYPCMRILRLLIHQPRARCSWLICCRRPAHSGEVLRTSHTFYYDPPLIHYLLVRRSSPWASA
ncbi:unnamed protein product [Prorocentrum cordatum]|uniref:Secreted protein n=1 Tax=Prorocentrum cordatum TaxID=2364126 RepID=A0ABN9PSS7_9DINO|nr:unnamed protein product [Polarella glacialis]